MSTLEISDLHVEVAAEGGPKEILTGVDLVVRGFFGEILARLPAVPELRERLEAAIEAELAVTGV